MVFGRIEMKGHKYNKKRR